MDGTGGTITFVGGNKIHTFTADGTFTVTDAGNADVLVVAGGGGGSNGASDRTGGGGGAGGVREVLTHAFTVGAKAVVVGAGGVANSGNGGPSSLDGISCVGGGHGGRDSSAAATGGSGGGERHNQSTGAAGTAGEGNAGAGGYDPGSPPFLAGGGGGAGAAAVRPTSPSPVGVGGAGISSSLSGAATFYGGGGGGGPQGGAVTVAAGGVGGGGDGNRDAAGSAGTNGLGGGGGGGANGGNGAAGGSGVVIISYPDPGQLTDVPFLVSPFIMYQPSFTMEPPFLSHPWSTFGNPVLFDGPPPPFPPPPLPGTGLPGGGIAPPFSAAGLGGTRFYSSPPWRWVVTELGPDDTGLSPGPEGGTVTFLDKLATDAEIVYPLDHPAHATLHVPSDNPEVNILHDEDDPDEPFVAEGRRNLYGFRREGPTEDTDKKWRIRFSGRILEVEDDGLTEDATTSITAYDPWQLLFKRPIRLANGNFPSPRGFTYTDTRGSTIALELLANTIQYDGGVGIDAGMAYGGTTYWQGTITPTPVLVDHFVIAQGMTVGEAWDQLVETGTLDILLTPIFDPRQRPGMLVDMTVVPQAGSIRDEAVLGWDTYSRNLTRINRKIDGTARADTVKYFTGVGGPSVPPETDAAMIALYGPYWTLQSFPSRTAKAVIAFAQLELALRSAGVTTVIVEPTPSRMPFLFTEFWLGDTVPETATDKLRAVLAGYQRIYGVRVTVDENSLEQVPQLMTGPGEGA
jgi:hypothetical protein